MKHQRAVTPLPDSTQSTSSGSTAKESARCREVTNTAGSEPPGLSGAVRVDRSPSSGGIALLLTPASRRQGEGDSTSEAADGRWAGNQLAVALDNGRLAILNPRPKLKSAQAGITPPPLSKATARLARIPLLPPVVTAPPG